MKFIFRLEDNVLAGDGCDYAFIDITRANATELVRQMGCLKKMGASEIRFRGPPIVFFGKQDLVDAMPEYPVEDIFEEMETSGSNWCRPDPNFEFPDAIKDKEPSMAWVEVVISTSSVRWEAAERKVDCIYVTTPLSAEHLIETRDKLVKGVERVTKLMFARFSALGRTLWGGYVRVPAAMTQKEVNEAIRLKYTVWVEPGYSDLAGQKVIAERHGVAYTLFSDRTLVEGDVQ